MCTTRATLEGRCGHPTAYRRARRCRVRLRGRRHLRARYLAQNKHDTLGVVAHLDNHQLHQPGDLLRLRRARKRTCHRGLHHRVCQRLVRCLVAAQRERPTHHARDDMPDGSWRHRSNLVVVRFSHSRAGRQRNHRDHRLHSNLAGGTRRKPNSLVAGGNRQRVQPAGDLVVHVRAAALPSRHSHLQRSRGCADSAVGAKIEARPRLRPRRAMT